MRAREGRRGGNTVRITARRCWRGRVGEGGADNWGRGVSEREAEMGDMRCCGGVADRQARAVDGRTRCAAELG